VFPAFPPILNNVGFHAPPQEPGWANDGTFNNQGYSSTPWTFTLNPPPPFPNSAMWNCETFAQNQNANAIRWGTLYNFRFDSSAPPATSTANIGFFKTGSPISVAIQAPFMTDTTATPTATPGQITLSARGYKMQGQQRVDLSWNGATSNNIDVYRNGALIATVPNIPGFYTDHIG